MKQIKTSTLASDPDGIAQAAAALSQGDLVALPTETVYGLGADARNDLAVARIFDAKGRPRFNPLIVHVAELSQAQDYVEWPDQAQTLANAYWPGPLTLVLPLKADHGLSALVTGGLSTLAIRVPAHPVALALLRAFNGPIAAPSANPSGKISPTTATHVAEGLSGRIEVILDGGACDVGLESTIIGLVDQASLLRPGGIPAEQIEQALNQPLVLHSAEDPLSAPGQLGSHYAPAVPVRLNADHAEAGEVLLGFGAVEATLNLSQSADLTEAAANLFHHLHALDAMAPRGIAVSPIPDHGLGRAINDRLQRAAAPRP
ncbi:MAG: threonylcarbamoyl-AMP synthase [Thalassovita sp.]